MAKSHKSCMEQAEIIDTFGTYQLRGSHASGLIFRRGAIDYVVDYTARFGVGAPLPPGVSLQIGEHRLFIGSFPEAFPRDVRIFSGVTDPLPTRGCTAAPGREDDCVHATVM